MASTIVHHHAGPACSLNHHPSCPHPVGYETCVDDGQGGYDCTHRYDTDAEQAQAQASMHNPPEGEKAAPH